MVVCVRIAVPPRCLFTEFMCDNQHCIPLVYVCDGFNNCGDSSDEVNCGSAVGTYSSQLRRIYRARQ